MAVISNKVISDKIVSDKIQRALIQVSDGKIAKVNAHFFKTQRGEYGYGDQFLGVRLPQIRRIVRDYLKAAALPDAVNLLQSQWHEVRLSGCILMVELAQKSRKNKDEKSEEKIYRAYLRHAKRINNWDLVDVSAPSIVGQFLMRKDRSILVNLAQSNLLWERRIAIVATWAFIKNSEPRDAFKISRLLLRDREDLIHKACGWMLREVGKHCGLETLNQFLDENATRMPRTMLRYALEKHPEPQRKKYLKLKIQK